MKQARGMQRVVLLVLFCLVLTNAQLLPTRIFDLNLEKSVDVSVAENASTEEGLERARLLEEQQATQAARTATGDDDVEYNNNNNNNNNNNDSIVDESASLEENKDDDDSGKRAIQKQSTLAQGLDMVAHVPLLSLASMPVNVAAQPLSRLPPFGGEVHIPSPGVVTHANTIHLATQPGHDISTEVKDILISPSFGPTSGGVWVQIVGAGSFYTPNSLQCKMDMIEQYCYSNHYFYSWCYLTPKCAGVYPFSCHNGPMRFSGKYAVVAKVPWITSVYPFSGSTLGGSPVTVRGWNFEPHCPHQLLCRFGDQIVPGKFYTSSSIMCIAPCSTAASFVSVEVSNDGGNHWSMSGVQFAYVGDAPSKDQMTECRRYISPLATARAELETQASNLSNEVLPPPVHSNALAK